MQHIVQIIPALGYGGAERLVVDLINHSDAKKYRFTIIVFFDNTPLKNLITKNLEIILVEKKSKLDFSFVGRLQNKLAELNPDLIHGHLFAGDFWGRLAAHRLGIPYLSTEHNLNYEDGWLKNFVKEKVSSEKDYYSACSFAVASYMKNVYKIKNKIAVIHNGIELKRFTGLSSAAFGEEINFLMVGRLVKQKGHIVALTALNNLKNYPWKLTIVGSGKEKNNLVNFVKKNKLSERVNFVEPTPQVEKYYEQADVFLMPSIWEGLGVVAMEAMASGRLVLVSDVDGLKEIVTDKENGYLAQPNSVSDWKEKIKYIFENKKVGIQLAKKARVYAKKNFSIEETVEKYNKFYSLIIK